MPKLQRKVGRPSSYTKETAKAICDELAKGRSLLKICTSPDFPSEDAVYDWLHHFPEFAEKYARARELQAEHYANEIIDISDETPVCEQPDPDGGVTVRVDAAGVQRNRLRVDARKWYASKVAPKKYGEKLELNGPGGGPIQAAITVEFVKAKESV